MPTNGASGVSSATGIFSQQAGKSELGKEDFLKLLVTQFKYQDPLNPMEDKEFIAQLAQFSALEQQMSTNEKMESLLSIQKQQQMIGAASFIGQEVSARGYGVSVKGDTISNIQYAINEEMVKGYVNIFDASNQLVTTVQLDSKAPGIHDFDWDGLLPNGSKVPDGVYTVNIAGQNSAGAPVLVDTSVSGKVEAVTLYQGDQILRLSDGRLVSLSNVREVVQPKTVEAGDDTESDDSEDGESSGGDNSDSGETNGTDETNGPEGSEVSRMQDLYQILPTIKEKLYR